MKQYKLIKTYPNAPNVGSVAYQNQECNFYSMAGKDFSSIENIENYPEFWQEIKEYPKILEVETNGNMKIILPVYHHCDILCSLNYEGYIITKVAKSESEVFTIGDKVNKTNHAPFIIDNFFYDEYEDRILARSNTKTGIIVEDVTTIEKVKHPLFTTEDGKDIYKNEKFWYVRNFRIEFYYADECWTPKEDGLEFSSVEAADKWIDENKPTFSKKQIEDILTPKPTEPSIYGIVYRVIKQKLGI